MSNTATRPSGATSGGLTIKPRRTKNAERKDKDQKERDKKKRSDLVQMFKARMAQP